MAAGGECEDDGVIRVRDTQGNLCTERLGPADDPEVVARKLLRGKHGRHGDFYGPIDYGRRVLN